MTAKLVDIRDEVFTRILLKKTLSGFVFNDFDIEKTWFPYRRLEDFIKDHPSGIVYIIGLAADDTENLSRGNMARREVPVQIGYQRANVDPQDTALIDTLIELEEQLRDVCRIEVDPEFFSWMRTESLKDENGVPYSFLALREANTFESFFMATYNLVLA